MAALDHFVLGADLVRMADKYASIQPDDWQIDEPLQIIDPVQDPDEKKELFEPDTDKYASI